ncbi:MAG: s-methyl-5-thioribose-1-phosphate isomerase, partial [Nanoarchaeota archaeon]
MLVNGKPYRTIWLKESDDKIVQIIDQRFLPHKFIIENIVNVDGIITAIKDMHVRGAPLIGATAAYGIYLATLQAKNNADIIKSAERIKSARPTAIDLMWAVDEQLKVINTVESIEGKKIIALITAKKIADESAEMCKRIGKYGVKIIEEISKKKNGDVVNILTHCNAGWLACVDYGTATSPIYVAFDKGIKVHVWVDETRPRNQGARLTAWELGMHGLPHTVIADNVGGHLMQHNLVDLVIVG